MVVLIGGRVSEPRGSIRCLWRLWLPHPRQPLRLEDLGRGHHEGEDDAEAKPQ